MGARLAASVVTEWPPPEGVVPAGALDSRGLFSVRVTTDEPWYSVRCVFSLHAPDGSPVFEERVTLWRSDSFEQAVALAAAEAQQYAQDVEGQYLGFAQAFHLASGPDLAQGVEAFSLIRASDLDPDAYLDHFFDTGDEYEGNLTEE